MCYASRVKWLLVGVALLAAGCGGSTSTAPTPTPAPVPIPTPTPPPVPALTIAVSACPESVSGVDLGFYRQIGCGAFDFPSVQSVRRWTIAPKVYIRTVDEAGAAIDTVTLDTVQNAMIGVAPSFTGNRFGLEGVLRGAETREGVSGWITVKWPTTSDPASGCGRTQVGTDGGWLELNYKVGGGCACGSSAIRPRTAKHELGHALGYWHTDNAGDLMTAAGVQGCDASPSARELAAAVYQYR